ncbi:MAG: hypothetical protein OXI60_05820 [Acidiferrobacterales bacterium]|nr:hypothetical protein [Acidiferrobacterales bacterium]
MYYRVVVRHNLVEEIRHQQSLSERQSLLHSNLEAGTLLSQNFRQTGCIDGEYCFDDSQRAKLFASVCMDFISKLLDSRSARIECLNHDEEYLADDIKRHQ